MLFFTAAILLFAVRDAQCKLGNHLKADLNGTIFAYDYRP